MVRGLNIVVFNHNREKHEVHLTWYRYCKKKHKIRKVSCNTNTRNKDDDVYDRQLKKARIKICTVTYLYFVKQISKTKTISKSFKTAPDDVYHDNTRYSKYIRPDG